MGMFVVLSPIFGFSAWVGSGFGADRGAALDSGPRSLKATIRCLGAASPAYNTEQKLSPKPGGLQHDGEEPKTLGNIGNCCVVELPF